MDNNKILSINFEKDISYEDYIIRQFWEQQKEEQVDQRTIETTYRNIIDSLELARHTVCIISDSELPLDILRSIQYLSDKGIRVYIISNNLYNSYSDTITGKCLIRYSNKVLGTMIIIDPISSGDPVAYVGSERLLTGADKWGGCIKLIKEQVEEAYHYFCWNFWRMTDYEVAVQEDVTKPKRVGETPFDIFPLLKPEVIFYNDISRDILTRKIIDLLESSAGSILISAEFIETDTEIFKCLRKKIEQNINCTIIVKMDTRNRMLFSEISNYKNVTLLSFSENLVQYLVIDNANGIILTSSLTKTNLENGKDNNLCFGVSIDNILLKDLSIIFKESTTKKGIWHYQREKMLSDIKGKSIIREIADGINTRDLEEVREYDEFNLGNFTSDNLRDLKNGNFIGEFTHEGLVKKVKYKYTLQPKLRNASYKKSQMYEQWKEERQRLLNYVNDLKIIVDGIEQRKSTLLQQFSMTLKRFMLGKNVAVKQMIKQIEDINDKIQVENFNREAHLRYVDEVNDIYHNISKYEEEISTAIDMDKKEQEWLKAKEGLEKGISSLSKEIETLTQEVENISQDNEEKRKNLYLKRSELQKSVDDIETKKYEFLNDNDILEKITDKQEKIEKIEKIIGDKIKEVKSANKKQAKKRFEEAKALIKKEVDSIMDNSNYYNNKMMQMVRHDGSNESVLNEMKDYVKDILLMDVNHNLSETEKELLEEFNSNKTALLECQDELQNLDNDINVLKQKSDSELKAIKNKIEKIENELARKQDDLEKMGNEFEYQTDKLAGDDELSSIMKKGNKNNKQSNKSNKLSSYSINMPNEDLPTVGTLYQGGDTRQLAIDYWSELENGEKEALRLEAELVCEREA